MNFLKLRFIYFLFGLTLASYYVSAIAEQKGDLPPHKIYFYNPESNINNFQTLKSKFDRYLSKFGAFKFQPFDDKDIFEKTLQDAQSGVFLLSSWHYRLLRQNHSLEAVLIGVINGQVNQKKILCSTLDLQKFEDLKGKKITTAGSNQYSKNLLMEMFKQPSEKLLNSIKLVKVPTDLDALSSLKYEVAPAALTTEASLEKLRTIYPKLHAQLRILGKSKQKFLTLVVIKKNDKKTQELLNILQDMSATESGENKLHMLGVDDWRNLTVSELKRLHAQELSHQ